MADGDRPGTDATEFRVGQAEGEGRASQNIGSTQVDERAIRPLPNRHAVAADGSR